MRRFLVGRLVDQDSHNPQTLNTRALLARFADPRALWTAPHYSEADADVAASPRVRLERLWRRRLWTLRMMLLYQGKTDAIFYPGADWYDDWGLFLRKASGRRVPVIATLEGLAGNAERERRLTEWAGHPVYCHRVPDETLARIDRVLGGADHVIAISPFLARMGRRLYGEKFSVVPLGVDSGVFFAAPETKRERYTVVGVGTFQERKRPGVFIELAARFPQADFVWYGDGPERESYLRQAEGRKVANVRFPGPLAHAVLAAEYRKAHLFVLPSNSEGVPKATQEAAACGLPAVVFGFYEAPTVADGENGFVVWDDASLFARVGELIGDREKSARMGALGAERLRSSSWEELAPLWEDALLRAGAAAS